MKRSMVDTRRGLQKAVILFALGWGMASTGAEPAEQMSFADGLFSRGLYDMAATEYESLLGVGTGFEGEDAALFRLAECYRSLGSKVNAERVYHQLMTRFPTSRFRYRGEFRRAELFLAARQYDKAAVLFSELLGRSPPDDIAASTHYFLGYTQEKQGMANEAESKLPVGDRGV